MRRKPISQEAKDLSWAFDRLDHMLFVYRHPETIQGHFGLQESMHWVDEKLPELVKRYGFKRCWPEPTAPTKGEKP